jgi:uncharacterized protein YkwD
MLKKSPQKKYQIAKRQSFLPMRLGAEAALAVLIVAVFSVTSLQSVLLRTPQLASVISAVLVDLANTDRVSEDVGMLKVSPVLQAAAQAKANDMAAKGYFAHVSPEGLDSWYWFRQAGYSFTYAGENLAADFSDSADVEKAWLASPTHRANLMNAHFTEIGIATAEGTYEGHPTTFVVQMFGTPAPSRLAQGASQTQAAASSEKPASVAAVSSEASGSNAQVLGASRSPSPAPSIATVTTVEPKPHTALTKAVALAYRSDNTQTLALATPAVQMQAPFWGFFASAPKTTLRYAYYFLGLLVLVVLIARTGIEIRLHHMKHIAYGGGLMVMMFGLFFIADRMIFTPPQLVVNDTGSALAT